MNLSTASPVGRDEIEHGIQVWLRHYLADLFDLPVEAVDDRRSFQSYGLDSSAAVALSGDLYDWLGCHVDATVAYEFPSVEKLARALACDAAVVRSWAGRAPAAPGAPR